MRAGDEKKRAADGFVDARPIFAKAKRSAEAMKAQADAGHWRRSSMVFTIFLVALSFIHREKRTMPMCCGLPMRI